MLACPECGLPARSTGHPPLRCERCGSTTPVDAPNAADDERPLGWILPTVRAHRWAESHHQLSCTQCGRVVDGDADAAVGLGWSMGVEADGRITWQCAPCARTHVRDIESKLPHDFWS